MIYLDNAATTKISPKVVEAMLPYLYEEYGNPSSVYSLGVAGKKAINQSRRKIAAALNANPDEIYFTSGGTESDNWALIGVAEAYAQKGKHIITTKIEHHAVLHTCKYLERRGYEITYLNVDAKGKVSLEELEKSIREDTILISIMFANNEIGTIQPIYEIGKIASRNKILFHTDAVQAFGQLSIDVKGMKIDLLSVSSHKINGPKGIGCLYMKDGVRIGTHIHGGAQERGKRAGTENVPAIVGFGVAVQMAVENMEEKAKKLITMRDYFMERILQEIPYCCINGEQNERLPNNVSATFDYVNGETLVIMLDMKGICASSGSACTSGATDPSHVMAAIGHSEDRANATVRFSLSADNTMEELDEVVIILRDTVEKLREMSPSYKDFIKRRIV